MSYHEGNKKILKPYISLYAQRASNLQYCCRAVTIKSSVSIEFTYYHSDIKMQLKIFHSQSFNNKLFEKFNNLYRARLVGGMLHLKTKSKSSKKVNQFYRANSTKKKKN